MNKITYTDLAELKQKLMQGEALPENLQAIKTFATSIKQVGEESSRRVRMTISTEAVDRDNDTIAVAGWDIENYLKNPVVLWAHDYGSLPVAKAVEMHNDGKRLIAIDEFVNKDVYPFADTVYQMLKAGFLNTSSVGFRGKKVMFNADRDGYDFVEQELLEHSIVPVPSNPEAYAEAKHMLGNDIMRPMLKWCEEVLDNWAHMPSFKGSQEELDAIMSDEEKQAADAYEQIKDANTFFDMKISKGVIPRDVSTELAPLDTTWARPKASEFGVEGDFNTLSATQKRRIAGHFAWAEQNPPEAYSQLSLPHHSADDGSVVWRGVTSAMAALLGARGGVDIPDADRRSVYNHLVRHYNAFEREAPSFRYVEAQVLKHCKDAYAFDEDTGEVKTHKDVYDYMSSAPVDEDKQEAKDESLDLNDLVSNAYDYYVPSQLNSLTQEDVKRFISSCGLAETVEDTIRQEWSRITGKLLD